MCIRDSYITIHGVPTISMQITPEYAGGTATQGIAVNAIPHVCLLYTSRCV